MRRAYFLSLLAAILMLASPVFLRAWETDLHYGLTKWLAVKAGFSLDEAEAIALATQSPDEGRLYPATFAVPLYACLRPDPQGSRFVQEHHFPSYAGVPSLPSKREVLPGKADNGATFWTRKELSGVFPDTPRNLSHRHFGFSLHPLQDSWSHQGIPDIPYVRGLGCSPEFAWSHPQARGGWRSHDADLTHLHVSDTVETAKATFEFLVQYRKRLGGGTAPRSWAEIEPLVRSFAVAATIEEKRKWFESDPEVPISSYAYRGFLDKINLPKTTKKPSGRNGPLPGRFELAAQRGSGEFPCARDFAERVLGEWIIKQNFGFLIENIDPQVGARLQSEGATTEATRDLVLTAFNQWLLSDHGLVNALGHGELRRGEMESFRELSRLAQSPELRMRFESLEQALRPVGAAEPFLLMDLPRSPDGSQSYGVIFQFRHTPGDTIIMSIERVGSRWQVVGLDWLVD